MRDDGDRLHYHLEGGSDPGPPRLLLGGRAFATWQDADRERDALKLRSRTATYAWIDVVTCDDGECGIGEAGWRTAARPPAALVPVTEFRTGSASSRRSG
jgi:hypothetical protein